MGAQHTPTPWWADDWSDDQITIVGPMNNCRRNGEEPAWEMCTVDLNRYMGTDGMEDEMKANASLIVRAVNAHEFLVNAVISARDVLDDLSGATGDDVYEDVLSMLNAALAKADAS